MYMDVTSARLRVMVVAAIMLPIQASAQQADRAFEQQINQPIQQDQQRRIEQQRELEDERRQRIRLDSPTLQQPNAVDDDATCFELSDIRIEGADWLSLEQKQAIIEPLLGQCVGRSQINQLLQNITALYFDAGFVTSRAYIAQQNIANGVLVIQVVEGEIESMRLNGNDPSINLATAFPNLEGKRLNLRDLEQGLEHINRLESCNSTIGLEPGSYLGASIINIDANCGNPFVLRLGRNNSGLKSTGEQQQSLFVSMDNPFSLNDYAYLSYQTDTKKEDRGKHSESLSGHWDMPLGYWLFSLNASRFEYTSLVDGSFSTFETTGTNTSQNLSVERTLHRDKNSKTRLATGLTRKHTKNYIEGTLIDTSSRVLAVADVSLQHEHFFSGGAQLISRLGYYRGLDRLGAKSDDKSEAGEPKAQFDKYTLSFDYSNAWSLADKLLILQSTFSAQQSDDELFSTEQLSIGSEYTVRGYKENSLSGNSGAYWRNTLGLIIRTPWANNWLQYVKPAIGLDAGLIRNTLYDDDKYAKLKGSSIGLNLGGEYFAASVTYSRAIDNPDYLPTANENWYFNLQLML